MKALLLLLSTGIAVAGLPRLTIEHGERRQDLRVDEVEVTVRVEGDLVETRMSLNFFNETGFNQEGEFRFPLPEGASVNHYALEVNGKMREATVVEKDQARRAYETIKARNIDPGLVEKMEGNIYRTRIFPVLPRQGKRVSIGFVQPMEKSGDRMVYRLPFGVAEKIGKFRLTVGGDLLGVTPEMTGGANLEKTGTGFSFSSDHSPVESDLVLSRAASVGGFSGEIREVGGESFAYLTGMVPLELVEQKGRKPGTLTVLWDASASGYGRDLKAELEFLKKVVHESGGVPVRLMAVHGEVENLGEFRDWKTLRAAVGGIFHDGAADWREVDFANLGGERVLLFGGNESAFPISLIRTKGVLQVIRSSGMKVDPVLAEMAEKSGGGVVDLADLKTGEAAGEGLEPGLRVVGMGGAVESFFAEIVDGQIRIFAKMWRGYQEEVTISLGRGGGAKTSISVRIKRAEGGNALRYLWAQRRLKEMARSHSLVAGSAKADVIAHCKTYGLVSDFTSLIVLERMEDHIEFRIPPPEPELMAEYQRGVERNKNLGRASRLAEAWKNRIQWHRKDFPWVEVALLPRYARVKKWTDAQTSVFEKEQLAQTNLAEFQAWQKQAEELMRGRDRITNRESFLEWEKQITGMVKSGEELGTRVAALPENAEFGVSVRGLVLEPQTMTLKNGATLREALKKAGGLHSAGSASRIALYRSGRRSVYNLLSKSYEDVELFPGDMVVAMAEPIYNYDPFSAGSSATSDGPAVIDQDVPLGEPVPAFAGSDRRAAEKDERPFRRFESTLLRGGVEEGETLVADEELIGEILEAEDVWAAYRNRRNMLGGGLADFAKVAGELYKRNESGKARRVLANFYHGNGIHVPSLRAAAYWMIQFEDYTGAGEIFECISLHFPQDALLGLDLMRLKRIARGTLTAAWFGKLSPAETGQALDDPRNTIPAELMMMERNRFQTKQLEHVTCHLPEDSEVFPSDLRIVVSFNHPEDGSQLEITEPTGRTLVGSGTSVTGGRLSQGGGVAEFMVRHAIPGDYRLEVRNVTAGTYQVEVFLNWGKENESRRMFTLSGQGDGGAMDAGSVEFDFGQP